MNSRSVRKGDNSRASESRASSLDSAERSRECRYGIALDDVLNDIEVPSLEAPDLDASFVPSAQSKDLFAEKSSTKSLFKEKNRRHKERNFASLISARLGLLFSIPFYEDIAECHSLSRSAWLAKNHRVGEVFTFGKEPPTKSNIIVFDDFVTTGATMISMRELLMPLGKNLVFSPQSPTSFEIH